MVRMGIWPGQVGHVFLTHHHFDHNVDFPCFALTRWDQSRGTEAPLQVYGPPPTRNFVELLLGEDGAFFPDWNARIKHPTSQGLHRSRGGVLPRPAPAIQTHDVEPGSVAAGETWTATAASVHHVEPWLESLAYRFDTDAGSIVFAGDCADCEQLRQIAQGVDTLVVACVGLEPDDVLQKVCTGASEAAEIAQQAGVQRVILSHASPGLRIPGRKERAVAQIARTYSGAIFFPDELTTLELST
jgi:ribonuclease Z